MTKQMTQDEQAMYPKVFKVVAYNHGSDTRDQCNEDYAYEVRSLNRREESAFYEGLNHEATLKIEVKLPNGVIK